MRWLIFSIFAYAMLAAQVGLRSLVSVGGVSPQFLLILAVYVGLMAPSAVVPWALLVLGLLVDLAPGNAHGLSLVGPAALGYLAGAYAVLQLRTLVFRQSVITLTALVLVAGVFVHLVIVALLTVRGVPWPLGEPVPGWSAADQLVQRFLSLLYTAVWAMPVGVVLFRTTPLWGFAGKSRGPA